MGSTRRSRRDLTYKEPEDVGPGAYDYEAALDSLAPKSPSPDLKKQYKPEEKIDPDGGPGKYSPNKDVVLIENPKWSFPGKYPTKTILEPGQDAGTHDVV